MNVEVFAGKDEVVGEAALPELRVRVMGEATLDALHGLRDVVGLKEQVDVVGHDDEREELVGTGCSVMLEGSMNRRAVASIWKRRRRPRVMAVMKKVPAMVVRGGWAIHGF